MSDADIFYRQFCGLISDDLYLEDRVEQYWRKPLDNPFLCTRYILSLYAEGTWESHGISNG